MSAGAHLLAGSRWLVRGGSGAPRRACRAGGPLAAAAVLHAARALPGRCRAQQRSGAGARPAACREPVQRARSGRRRGAAGSWLECHQRGALARCSGRRCCGRALARWAGGRLHQCRPWLAGRPGPGWCAAAAAPPGAIAAAPGTARCAAAWLHGEVGNWLWWHLCAGPTPGPNLPAAGLRRRRAGLSDGWLVR